MAVKRQQRRGDNTSQPITVEKKQQKEQCGNWTQSSSIIRVQAEMFIAHGKQIKKKTTMSEK